MLEQTYLIFKREQMNCNLKFKIQLDKIENCELQS